MTKNPKRFPSPVPSHETPKTREKAEGQKASEGYLLRTKSEKNIDQPSPRERKPRISPRLREIIELLVTGACKTQRAACQRVGMSETYLSEKLKSPAVHDYLVSRARRHLSAGTLAASRRMIELIDGPSAPVAFDAAKFVLGVDGVKPNNDANVSVSVDVRAGFVIDLSEDNERPSMKIVSPASGAPVAAVGPRMLEHESPAEKLSAAFKSKTASDADE